MATGPESLFSAVSDALDFAEEQCPGSGLWTDARDALNRLEILLEEGARMYEGSSRGFALSEWQERAKEALGV